MKRLAGFLVLILVFIGGTVSTLAQQRRQDDHDRAYGRQDNRRDPRWDNRSGPRDGACFYKAAGFRGSRFCVRAGERLPKLPDNFGDHISSIQIVGRARVRVFNDGDYRNGSRMIRRTVPDLRELRFRGGHTWNNRISSIIVYY